MTPPQLPCSLKGGEKEVTMPKRQTCHMAGSQCEGRRADAGVAKWRRKNATWLHLGEEMGQETGTRRLRPLQDNKKMRSMASSLGFSAEPREEAARATHPGISP